MAKHDSGAADKPTRAPAGNDYLRAANARIGRAIRETRRARGMSAPELVEALQARGATHLHESTIGAIERGVQAARAAEIADIAGVLGVDVADLLATPLDVERQWLEREVWAYGSLSTRVAQSFREWPEMRAAVVRQIDALSDADAEEMSQRFPELWDHATTIRAHDARGWVGPILASVFPETFAARHVATETEPSPTPDAAEMEER